MIVLVAHSIKARKKNLNLKGFKYSTILTPRCSAVRPWLLATLTLASLSSSSDTESTWPPATASIRGVLQTRIRGCVRERNDRLNNLEQMKENWKKRKQKRITHCPWESAASTRSALSDSSSRRRTHVVWPFITGGSDGERECDSWRTRDREQQKCFFSHKTAKNKIQSAKKSE